MVRPARGGIREMLAYRHPIVAVPDASPRTSRATEAVLFDLDGTLLPIDFDAFLPRYFGALRAHVGPALPGVDLLALVVASTEHMVGNDGAATNQERFWGHFGERIRRPRDEVERLFDDFYGRDFPRLGAALRSDPAAAPLVRACRERGLRVALATNPVFPRAAIEERMRWAGLEPGWFDLVTSYETSTYCKPHPGFYREVAARLEVAPARCLMVGNDVGQDVVPAAAAGMRTCLVRNAYRVQGDTGAVPDHEVHLGDVLGLV